LSGVLFGGRLGYLMQLTLLAVQVAAIGPNARFVQTHFDPVFAQPARAVERDLMEGVTVDQVVQSFATHLSPGDANWVQGELHPRFTMLYRAGVGPYGRLQPVPDCREVDFSLESNKPQTNMKLENGAWVSLGDTPFLAFHLDQSRHVYAIRLEYVYEQTTDPASFRMEWQPKPPRDENVTHYAKFDLRMHPAPLNVTVFVNASIDQFRIVPDDKPCRFRLSRLTLFVPVTPSAD
jgi:hypothetical protein